MIPDPGPGGRRTPRAPRALRAPSLLSVLVVSTGCSGYQSALNPQGPQAASIATLWWVMLGISIVVTFGVALGVWLAVFRRNRQTVEDAPEEGEPGKVKVVTILTAATVVILIYLIVHSVTVGNAISRMPNPPDEAVVIEVIGHQWWWEVRYADPVPSRRFTTANELRIPVGRPVIVRGTSRDVIHSFWVPNLHGKVDLTPGRTTTLWFQADAAGEFRGQCAEFCGLQHAKMAFMVVALPPEEFEAWADAYRQPARPPATDLERRGRQVFLEEQCSICHAIRGTGALASVAPDLTRIGIRRTLAAGTVPNTRGHLAGWIIDPQNVKPGNFMPPTNLDSERLRALIAYLESLQ